MKKIINTIIVVLVTINAFAQSTLQSSAYPGLKLTHENSQIWLNGGGIHKWSLGTTGASGSNFIIYDNNEATKGVKFSIDDLTGNVGIGTSLPTSNLHIYSNSNPQILLRSGATGLRGLWTTVNDSKEVISFNSSYNNTGIYPITFEFGNKEKIRFAANGNIGLGTVNPRGKLEIYNDNTFQNSESNFYGDNIVFKSDNFLNGNYFGGITWNNNNRRRAAIVAVKENDDSDHVGLAFFTRGTDGPGPMFESMRISRSGNVGIGTTDPGSYKLAVQGKLGAREVVVTEADWADFVFEPTYNLKTLEEVEHFIKTNKHLPDVPSEKEVKENGLSLGQSDAVLLQKIEELTLYLIEQNKTLKRQNEKIVEMEREIKELKNSNN
ncbi:MAG: hypothetical protein HC831_09560 [Chloroflexia bacterium]|nr:hypothetical protein [Chloroflexia bacterium]